jgi:hypothetical protein
MVSDRQARVRQLPHAPYRCSASYPSRLQSQARDQRRATGEVLPYQETAVDCTSCAEAAGRAVVAGGGGDARDGAVAEEHHWG